ncbi:hypothetical protein V3C33_16070 [Micrococcaceae bacterium Sec5.7]
MVISTGAVDSVGDAAGWLEAEAPGEAAETDADADAVEVPLPPGDEQPAIAINAVAAMIPVPALVIFMVGLSRSI